MTLKSDLSEGSGEPTNALTFLSADHQRVNSLFHSFEELPESSTAERKRLLRQMNEELTVHARIEEQIFYPAVRELLAEGDPLVQESIHEHQEVKDLLIELQSMDPGEPRFRARMSTLIGQVRHHVHEEESAMFPKLRQAVGETPLGELGRRLKEGSAHAKASFGSSHPEPQPLPESGPDLIGSLFEPATAARPEPEPQPSAKRSNRAKKATAKKATAKKATAKKATAKKATAKKATAKKATAKKATAKKATAKKASKAARVPKSKTQAPRHVYHVVSNERGGWSVRKQNTLRASSSHDRKADALLRGRALAKRGGLRQLIVHNADGTIQNESTYGEDPRRTRG